MTPPRTPDQDPQENQSLYYDLSTPPDQTPKQTPATPPAPPVVPPSFPSANKKRGKGMIWLFIGIGLLVISGITATVLYFVLNHESRSYTYSDGQNPEVEEEVIVSDLTTADDYSVPDRAANSEIPVLRGAYQVSGQISQHPYTMSIDISPDGVITGTYWNVLYDIKLPVSGSYTPSGNLDITLGQGSEESHLFLNRESEFTYTGTWGKKNKRVTARLQPGSSPTSTVSDYDARRFRVTGGGINAIARLGRYFRYENQGNSTANALRAETDDDLNYTLYTSDGNPVAHIELIETVYGTSGIMTDITNRRFELVEE